MSYFFTKNNTHMTQLLSELKVPPLEHPIEVYYIIYINISIFPPYRNQNYTTL